MNERLMFLADELRDAVFDAERLGGDADDIARQIARVAEDLRAMAFDPRYDVEGCDENGCRVPQKTQPILRIKLDPANECGKL